MGVDLGDGVRIDAQGDRELPHRRQLIARSKSTCRDGRENPPLELCVQRRRVAGVDCEPIPGTHKH